MCFTRRNLHLCWANSVNLDQKKKEDCGVKAQASLTEIPFKVQHCNTKHNFLLLVPAFLSLAPKYV